MRVADTPGGAISTFTTREVADLLGSSPQQVRRLARSDFIQPNRGPGGRFEFTFQDVSILRTALKLVAARIPPRRIRVALSELRRQVPAEQPLSAVGVDVAGDEVIARDARAVWNPESGQTHFDFMTAPLDVGQPTFEIVPAGVAVGPRTEVHDTEVRDAEVHDAEESIAAELGAEEWYQLGCRIEETAADEAEAAFRRTLAEVPTHRPAHLALGYLLHQSGRLDEAVLHYRLAADAEKPDGLAAFNLGVALEDLGCPAEAMRAYEQAVGADPELADAHYNLGRLREEAGERAAAFEHFRTYKRLKKY